MGKECSICGVQFTSKSNGAKYCPDCRKTVRKGKYAGYSAKNKAKQRYRGIKKHKNDNSYNKNKVILFNFQWYAVVYSSKNYMVVKKTKGEGGKDIWDVVREAVKRRRVTYHGSLESALFSIYERMLVNNAKSKFGYGADIFSLKNLIVEVKKELLAAVSRGCDNSLGQFDADGRRQRNEEGLKNAIGCFSNRL